MSIQKNSIVVVVVALTVALAAVAPVAAQVLDDAESRLTQEITAGVATTDIRDASGNVLSNPAFQMGGVVASTQQQTATGTFGSSSQRVTVDNPGGANGGWTLTWNATTPGTGTWTGSEGNYAYNGATAADGQLTVTPSAGTITPVIGGATGVSLGTAATFTGTTPVTLVTATAGSADVWNGYITGVGLSQTVPAAQPVGSYVLNMTQTLTAV